MVLSPIAHASPDARLTSLIPPGAQLVSGISASSSGGQPGNFVLMTGDNKVDLTDFYALVGADETRRIHQIVFVALSDRVMLNEHSLLASGHFDKSQLFKAALSAGATINRYRGIELAEIRPFEREKKNFGQIRWLTVLDSSVLVLGSIPLLQMELDRYLSHSQVDDLLLSRSAHLRSKNQAWCVLAGSIRRLSLPAWSEEIRRALAAINPDLANRALSAEEFEFGLFYGRKVELEYFLSATPGGNVPSLINASKQALPESARPTALLSAVNTTTSHRVIAIPTSRFEEWLADIANRR
jgi:hypothetical protein